MYVFCKWELSMLLWVSSTFCRGDQEVTGHNSHNSAHTQDDHASLGGPNEPKRFRHEEDMFMTRITSSRLLLDACACKLTVLCK